jgi:hypothetical protein
MPLKFTGDMSLNFKEFLKEASMQVGAGGSSGFAEICIMYPLDLIKTRFQLQTTIIVSAVNGTGHLQQVSNNNQASQQICK